MGQSSLFITSSPQRGRYPPESTSSGPSLVGATAAPVTTSYPFLLCTSLQNFSIQGIYYYYYYYYYYSSSLSARLSFELLQTYSTLLTCLQDPLVAVKIEIHRQPKTPSAPSPRPTPSPAARQAKKLRNNLSTCPNPLTIVIEHHLGTRNSLRTEALSPLLSPMSTTQAPSSTAEASEEVPLQAQKPTVLSSTPNHASGPSTSAQNPSSPSTELKSDKVKQNGSVASSRRSDKAEPQPSAATNPSASLGPSLARPEKKRQKGGVSGFFSFLNCCGGSRDTSDVDLQEHPVPTQRPAKAQASQQEPAKAKDVSAAESSTGESKDVSAEKIGGTPYADLKSAGEPRTEGPGKPAAPSATLGSQIPTADEQSGAGTTGPGEGIIAGQFLGSSDAPSESKSSVADGGATSKGEYTEGEKIINDRTPQQEKIDTDIEMSDAPPADHTAVPGSKGTGPPRTDTTPPLPPPPPITPQRQESPPRQTEANQINGPNEQQRWLLPPIKPEHKGRKCLILDLDETLVHSSFKVSFPRWLDITGFKV